jgi:transposase
MGYELTDHEWTAIKPMLPNKPSTWKPHFTSENSDYRK